MTDQELRTRVQKAVDHKLSGVKDDPWLAQRVMNRAEEGEPVMKKKLSVSFVFVLVGILALGTALAAAIHTDFFSRVFGNETRENVEMHTEVFDDDKGGNYEAVFPGREFVAVDPDMAERLIGDRVMNEPVTVQMNAHMLTILSAVRDENAMVMEMTLENPDGETALVFDQLLNEEKGAYFGDASDIWFGVDMAAEMIYVDMKNSTDTCLHLLYYCVFFEKLPDGEIPQLVAVTADMPLQDAPEEQRKENRIPVPAERAVKTLQFASENGETIELSPFSMKISQAPVEGGASLPDNVIVLPDPGNIAAVEIRYADGGVYTVLDPEKNLDNTMYQCGGLGAEGLDTTMALNRLVDTDQVQAVAVNGVVYTPVR